MNLNKTFINSLTFDGVEKTYFDDVLKGFGVRVGKSSASYIVMYRNVYGKQKKITIAKTTQIAPAQARDEAKKILALVVQGKDPASDKIEKRKEMTVADLADKFLTDRKPRIKASFARDLPPRQTCDPPDNPACPYTLRPPYRCRTSERRRGATL